MYPPHERINYMSEKLTMEEVDKLLRSIPTSKDEYPKKISETELNDLLNDLKLGNVSIEEEDNVNHPKHYCRNNAMECIDEMKLIFGIEATMNFCKCNAWKYRYRAADKNGSEDIAKSDWYITKYKELKDEIDQ